MDSVRNIFLVGFMASGKTSVGRALSKATGWPFIDADDRVVQRAGKTIDQIFRDSGEPAFRALERSVFQELSRRDNQVIAAGGGAFVDPRNRELMLSSGAVFCLSARADTIYRRILEQDAGAAVRPLLAGDDPMGRIEELLAQRAAAYAYANHTIETDTLAPEEIAEQITRHCRLGTSKLEGPTPGG